MGSEWNLQTIQEFAVHQKGFAFKSKDYQETGTPVVRVSNFTTDSIDCFSLYFVSEKIRKETAAVELMKNDVVIATVGSWPKNPASIVGKTIRVPSEASGSLLNQNAVRLRAKSLDVFDQVFLYYLLKDQKFSDYIVSTAQGSANQASITLKDIYRYSFQCPTVDERKLIAQILNSLDKKIELNRQTNETLEKMAQALFKSWFVDFDPVIDNALEAGNTIPDELQDRAERRQQQLAKPDHQPLPDAIRQLFPDEFELTEALGWVPMGWKVDSLLESIELVGGGTPKTTTDEYWGGNIPWFSVVDAPSDSDVFVIDTEKHVSQEGVDNSSTKILRKGTTIISARGTVGKCALVAKPMAMNQSCYGIQGKETFPDEYVYYLIRCRVSDLQQRGHGSVFNTITRDTFESIRSPLPSEAVMAEFSSLVAPLFEKLLANGKQAVELTKLRDTLLPKLISGELRLPPDASADAEQQLANAVS